jgi:hypothetical protein
MAEFTSGQMDKIKQAATNFKDQVAGFFKDYSAEVKDWRFAVEGTEGGYVVDAQVKVLVKQKSKK